MTLLPPSLDLLVVDGSLPVVAAQTGSRGYDFAFRTLLAARSAGRDEALDSAVLRIGPISDYSGVVRELNELGIVPVNSVSEHARASQLSHWYELAAQYTPKSRWYTELPSAAEVANDFGWPVFVKGDRQTSRHRADRAVARDASEFEQLMDRYRRDPILHWQKVVVREFLSLRMVEPVAPGGLQASFEFRTFWWRKHLVAAGPYWSTNTSFRWTSAERLEALDLAEAVAMAVDVPFLVVDVAQDEHGKWWLIECNDAQESSFAGCQPLGLWQELVRLVRLER